MSEPSRVDRNPIGFQQTAGQVVRDALSELTIQADEQTVEPIEMSAGIRYMNRMMASLSLDGVKVGYTYVNAPNDILTVPAGITESIVFNLALRLASGYDMPISPDLRNNAMMSMVIMENYGVQIGKANFSGNVPLGSGNEYDSGGFSDDPFFPGTCEDQDLNVYPTNGDKNGL